MPARRPRAQPGATPPPRRSAERRFPGKGLTLLRVLGAHYKEKRLDYIFPGERHAGIELCYVDRGAVHAHVSRRGVPAQDLILSAGALMVWLPGEFHSLYAAPGPAPNIVTVHAVGPLPPGLERLSMRALALPALERELLTRLVEEARAPGLASAERQAALLTELLVGIARRRAATPAPVVSAKAPGANVLALRRMLAEEARAEIERRLSALEEVDLAGLARALQVSPSHLSHTFRAVEGVAVMAYVRRQRLKRAAELLRDSALSVTEIARKCGFEAIHPFSRAFKKALGYSPRAYSRSVRPGS